MANQANKGLKRVINAFGYSMKGLRATFKNEEAFRQELLLCLVLAPVALWLGKTGLERAVMVATLFLVLITELLNSGLEAITDRIGLEQHKLSGRAKDMGSAAVLLSIVNVIVVWALVLLN